MRATRGRCSQRGSPTKMRGRATYVPGAIVLSYTCRDFCVCNSHARVCVRERSAMPTSARERGTGAASCARPSLARRLGALARARLDAWRAKRADAEARSRQQRVQGRRPRGRCHGEPEMGPAWRSAVRGPRMSSHLGVFCDAGARALRRPLPSCRVLTVVAIDPRMRCQERDPSEIGDLKRLETASTASIRIATCFYYLG
jgi:hypothetical protein